MKILDNTIINFNYSGTFEEAVEREVEFLQSFLSEQNQLVFLQLKSNIYPSENSEITYINEEIKEIIFKNTILKTKEKLSDLHYETDKDECFYWFSLKSKEEIIKIVKDNIRGDGVDDNYSELFCCRFLPPVDTSIGSIFIEIIIIKFFYHYNR